MKASKRNKRSLSVCVNALTVSIAMKPKERVTPSPMKSEKLLIDIIKKLNEVNLLGGWGNKDAIKEVSYCRG